MKNGFFSITGFKLPYIIVMMPMIRSIGKELAGWSLCKQMKHFFYFGHFTVKDHTV